MKTLKSSIGTLVVLILLFNLTACKKNDGKDNGNANFDITQYYIAGKLNSVGLSVPYILTFDVNAKSISQTVGLTANTNYTYKDGTLTIDYGAGNIDVFKIENNAIVSYSGIDKLTSYSLEKIPATNQFDGNSFSGGWRSEGSTLILLSRLKFNASMYGESSLGEPTINRDYTLIKNIAATSNHGNNGILSFYVFINGKLEGARLIDNKVSLSTFSKL